MHTQRLIEDVSNALEQGRCAVYRRRFDAPVYEYMGGYISAITGYAAKEITPEIWDGLIEASDSCEEMYGEDRMMDFLKSNSGAEPVDLMDALIRDVHCFAGSNSFEDDVCILNMSLIQNR